MKRSKFTDEQIIGILREQEAGAKTAEPAGRSGRSDAPPASACYPLQEILIGGVGGLGSRSTDPTALAVP